MAALAVFMFSLTGVPPRTGFYGKDYIILAAIQAHLTWLAVVVVIFSAISAYFTAPAAPWVATSRACTAAARLRATRRTSRFADRLTTWAIRTPGGSAYDV